MAAAKKPDSWCKISLLFACSALSPVNRIVTGSNLTTDSNLADSLEGEES